MKNLYKTRKFGRATLMGLAAVLLISVGFYACKKPNDGINLLVNTSSLSKSPTVVTFSNANKMSTTAIPEFTATISGAGAKFVQSDGGGTSFSVKNGFLPLTLTADAAPTVSNPVVFNVYVQIPGFAPVSKTISVASASEMNYVNIPLVEYASPPSGSSVLNTTTPMSGNAITSLAKLTTLTNATLNETATLSIPSGTQMLDGSGAVISATSLNSTIVQYGTSDPTLGASFPGGLAPANVIGANGQPIVGGVQFVTAGALGINMTAGTKDVKGFSKPVNASIQLQPGMINFLTGAPIKAGETIPVWSYNETTGQWKSDGIATVGLDANGKLAASFNITHLTIWNLDWTWYPNPTYNTTVHNLAVNFKPSNTPWVGNYFVMLQTANGNLLADWGYSPQTDFYIQQSTVPTGVFQVVPNTTVYGKYGFGLTVVPTISQAKVMVQDNRTGIAYYSPIFNPMTATSVDVNITVPSPPEYIDVNLNIIARCSNKNVEIKPSGWFQIYDRTDGSSSYCYLSNGIITASYGAEYIKTNEFYKIRLVAGHQYSFTTCNNGTYYSSTAFTLNKSNFKTTAAGITLEGTYSQTDKTLTIGGSYNNNCK